ncbi:MAG: GFA family protein [Rubrobacteraceae bacterium]
MKEEIHRITATGGCLCGAVKYEVRGPLRPVVNCHCGQCRRASGHFVAASGARGGDLSLVSSEGLRWYESSPKARRGFCGVCGSSLFWEPVSGGEIMIMAGTMDSPTGLETVVHIFVDDAGDYYGITDDLPRLSHGDHGVEVPEV